MVSWTGPGRTRPDDSRSYRIPRCRLWKMGKREETNLIWSLMSNVALRTFLRNQDEY